MRYNRPQDAAARYARAPRIECTVIIQTGTFYCFFDKLMFPEYRWTFICTVRSFSREYVVLSFRIDPIVAHCRLWN